MNRTLLIDSNSLVNKAYYGMPKLTAPDGTPTGAVCGFMNMYCSLLEKLRPTHVVAVFDLHDPTFRKKMYEDYKAGRSGMPEELQVQIPILKELLSLLNVKICELSGYEADDIIGTLAKRFGACSYIVSGDKDVLQLVSDTTDVWLSRKGVSDIEAYTLPKMRMDNFLPYQVIEYKALAGDTADNIKGVPGIGEKTAKELLNSFKTIDNIYENISYVSKKVRDKLIAGKESAYFSKTLATIDTNVPIQCSLSDAKHSYIYEFKLVPFLEKLNFNSLYPRLNIFYRGELHEGSRD